LQILKVFFAAAVVDKRAKVAAHMVRSTISAGFQRDACESQTHVLESDDQFAHIGEGISAPLPAKIGKV
jgi:hypothetical protein